MERTFEFIALHDDNTWSDCHFEKIPFPNAGLFERGSEQSLAAAQRYADATLIHEYRDTVRLIVTAEGEEEDIDA
jgi:hypothetical protein